MMKTTIMAWWLARRTATTQSKRSERGHLLQRPIVTIGETMRRMKIPVALALLALVAVLAMAGCGGSQASASGSSGAASDGSSAAASDMDADRGIAKIAAIYSAPDSQIVTDERGSKVTADTFVYIYGDGAYRQYVVHDGQLEPYSEGTCELDGELNADGPVIVTFHVDKMHQEGHGLGDVDFSYDVDLSKEGDFCLYPAGDNSDKDVVAAFMQVDKQKLVKQDGTEAMLTTMWFYYGDGTFQQFALSENGDDVLFSEGVYSVSNGSFVDKDAVLTIHRTKKYQDGEGLAPYDSTHDYVIGDLEFLRIYPEG